MSSGNPFRASQSYSPATSSHITSTIPNSSKPQDSGSTGDYAFPDQALPSLDTEKHVRIRSSTISITPQSHGNNINKASHDSVRQRTAHIEHAGSSPLANFAASLETAQPDTSWMLNSTESLAGVPFNPFSQTLASIDPRGGVNDDLITGSQRSDNVTPLDVEGFKDLIMTGKSLQSILSPNSYPPVPADPFSNLQLKNGNSSDSPPVSRQSLFEASKEIKNEPSRASHNTTQSDDDDGISLMSNTKAKKKPPPTPKHRHGKPVTPRQPQVVSFDTFAATEPIQTSTTRNRGYSEASRPLPPTPVTATLPSESSEHATRIQNLETAQKPSSKPSLQTDSLTIQKKSPPAVPLARRQSQLRSSTISNRSRSNSSLTASSQHPIEPVTSPVLSINDSFSSLRSPPPPPPPPRYGARRNDTETSSISSSSTDLTQQPASPWMGSHSQNQSPLQRNPLEADFDLSFASTGIKRTPSMSSNGTRHRAVSSESTGSTRPPPPPPRRKAGRLSMDISRPNLGSISSSDIIHSMENRRPSVDGKRRTSAASETSLRYGYTPANEKGGNEFALSSPIEESESILDKRPQPKETKGKVDNILDDMEKFQREIDALRNNIDRTE